MWRARRAARELLATRSNVQDGLAACNRELGAVVLIATRARARGLPVLPPRLHGRLFARRHLRVLVHPQAPRQPSSGLARLPSPLFLTDGSLYSTGRRPRSPRRSKAPWCACLQGRQGPCMLPSPAATLSLPRGGASPPLAAAEDVPAAIDTATQRSGQPKGLGRRRRRQRRRQQQGGGSSRSRAAAAAAPG